MKVICELDYTDLPGDHKDIPSVRVTCTRCGHATESFGESERSVRRCLALLGETCPRHEDNFYTVEED